MIKGAYTSPFFSMLCTGMVVWQIKKPLWQNKQDRKSVDFYIYKDKKDQTSKRTLPNHLQR
jgi:hypothetical protein